MFTRKGGTFCDAYGALLALSNTGYSSDDDSSDGSHEKVCQS